jgi:dTDP-4-dehydrorhamnose 3,5-epimerase-like enzyme
MIMDSKESMLINFNEIKDERGSLVSLENMNYIPFEIKRVYYIYNTKSREPRGFHAHKKLQQVLVCVSGSCSVLLDDGEEKKTVHLNKPSQGLYITNMIWREMYDFSEDCVLMVLASDFYNEEDYIRDYQSFIIEVRNV